MVFASRRGPKGGLVTPFGLGFLTFVIVPSAIGSQDLAALVARQPIIAERPVSRFSLISTAHGATFTMPRPMSAAMPPALSYTLAGLDTSYADITGSIRERLLGEALVPPDELEPPVPNRQAKGNRLTTPQAEERTEATREDAVTAGPAPGVSIVRRRRRLNAALQRSARRKSPRRKMRTVRPPNLSTASRSVSRSRVKRPIPRC